MTILRLIKFNFQSKIAVVPNQEREQLEQQEQLQLQQQEQLQLQQQEQLQLQQQEQLQNSAADGQTIKRHGCKTKNLTPR